MPAFERDGVTFNYIDIGRGIPVVYQHGLGGNLSQATAVLGNNPEVRLLAMDARGHGETDPIGDVSLLGFETFADDVAAMLDDAGVQRAVIGGASMGAGIALTFAHRHPERTLGLMLIRPAWLDQQLPDNLALFPDIASLLRQHGPEAGLARFRTMPGPLDDNPPGAIEMLASQFGRAQAVERAAVLERMAGDCPPHGPTVWGGIAAPTLVIATEQDTIHPAIFGRTLAAAIPNAELTEPISKWIDETAHNQAVEAAVLDFVSRRISSEV
ncbi:MAG: alpha/beta fold hydrolase [Thermomicrobiales bacterium]